MLLHVKAISCKASCNRGVRNKWEKYIKCSDAKLWIKSLHAGHNKSFATGNSQDCKNYNQVWQETLKVWKIWLILQRWKSCPLNAFSEREKEVFGTPTFYIYIYIQNIFWLLIGYEYEQYEQYLNIMLQKKINPFIFWIQVDFFKPFYDYNGRADRTSCPFPITTSTTMADKLLHKALFDKQKH